MDRRTALKNLTKALGYTVTIPTISHMLSSCKTETNSWTPHFLSKEEKHIVTHLADIILPTTATPGALDVNVPQFLDLMYHDIENAANKKLFRDGAAIFSRKFMETFNLEAINGDKENFVLLLSNYFNISSEASKIILNRQRLRIKNIKKDELENYKLYKFLLSVKRYTLFGYFTSEKIGENILAYDPIPGVQKGCISVDKATSGKVYALK